MHFTNRSVLGILLAHGLTVAVGLVLASGSSEAAGAEWPQFRGPDGQGHAEAADLPLTWSEKDNVAWKAAIPGLGWSSPVIAGKQIWLTTAVDGGRTLKALCDRVSGKIVHDVTVFPNNTPINLTPPNSHASPTPIIEGDRVYVHFGQYGTACLTKAGKIVWKKNLRYQSLYGPSSSPVLCGDLLIVTCDGTDVRYLAALDKRTGAMRWKKHRDGRNSESTPLVIRVGGARQVVSTYDGRVTAYDGRTGKAIWWARLDWGYALVPRPVVGHGMVYVAGGYFTPTVYALRPDGRGDVTRTHIAWSQRRAVPNNPSPLLLGNELYLVTDKGVASCLDAKTGKYHWTERVGGFHKLATNRIDGRTLGSLAVAGKAIYLRSDHHLYRLEKGTGLQKGFQPARPDERRAAKFSLERAARSMDASARAWQQVNQCSQCHANFMHLIARPALAKVVK
jgi:outer membrane protein assembly factor BamB